MDHHRGEHELNVPLGTPRRATSPSWTILIYQTTTMRSSVQLIRVHNYNSGSVQVKKEIEGLEGF